MNKPAAVAVIVTNREGGVHNESLAKKNNKQAGRRDNMTVKHWNTGASAVRFRDQAGKRTSRRDNIYDRIEKIDYIIDTR